MKIVLMSQMLVAGLLVIHAFMLVVFGNVEVLGGLRLLVKPVIGMRNVIVMVVVVVVDVVAV